MTNLTLSIPDDLKKKMDAFPELNWSEIARKAIKTRIEQFEILERIAKNSTLTEEDAIILGKKINKAMAKRYR